MATDTATERATHWVVVAGEEAVGEGVPEGGSAGKARVWSPFRAQSPPPESGASLSVGGGAPVFFPGNPFFLRFRSF
jgi:hypothetical protein